MKKIITLLVAIGLAFSSTNAQVGMGTTQPHASSILELSSTTQGFLLPRMTNAEMKDIENPAEALMVYNTDLDCIMIHVNGSYTCVQNPLAGPPTKAAELGSYYVDHKNGWDPGTNTYEASADGTALSHTTGEAFSANTTCATNPISVTACDGVLTVTGESGIEYNLVEINGQCWMQDNLQEVPASFASFDGTYTTRAGALGHWGFWSSPSGSYGAAEAKPKAGFLYTWNAAMDNATAERSRGACPQGFHIPSDCEIKFLEHGLGMSILEQNDIGQGRGTNSSDGDVVEKLENLPPAGFNLFDVGHLNNAGSFLTQNNYSMWTSNLATGSTTSAYFRYHRSAGTYGLRDIDPTNNAFSVRCLKD